MFNTSQRAVITVLLFGFVIYLTIRFGWEHTSVANPQPAEGIRATELADRLDPNSASAPEIAAIPNVGEKLAQAIVDHREQYLRVHPEAKAFEKASDLLKVKGVGAAKMELLMGYMVFPGKPTTRAGIRGG